MKYTTNLFPQKDQSTLDKLTYFALHYLRYILVITQFITICVFFYRFKVDQDIVDLRETISQQKAIVDTTHTLLDRVQELDFKIETVKSLYSQQDLLLNQYNYTIQQLPPNVIITEMSIGKENIDFAGQTQNIDAVRSLYDQLRDEKQFSDVALNGINKNESGFFTFRLNLTGFNQTNGSE